MSAIKRPIEDEHRDANYQAHSNNKRKTATWETSVVSEHCIVDKIEDMLDKMPFFGQ